MIHVCRSSPNPTSNTVPSTRVRPPGLVTCTSNQVGAAFDGVGCAVFQNVVCAHVVPPLCCRAVGAIGVLNNEEGAGEGEGGADAVPVSTVLFGDIPGGIQRVHVRT